jgi:valyl-tRNA synthetase
MSDFAKAFDPKLVEEKWYAAWEGAGYFCADARSSKPPFSIVMPPPNVTGVLHMGHALVSTLQDTLCRWKRMLGFEVLWVPGTDHAGIATQTVVERDQMAKTGKRRTDFSRDEFLKHVWAWKEASEGKILSQLRKVGCSCDWSRLAFTMDEERSVAVGAMFKKMFDDGLIFRGDYLVNWDPVTQTALADDEVEYEDRASFLWYLKYPIEGSKDVVVVATTRPETMLGDTAVAVSPSDERYAHLIGKMIDHPITGRKIPVIADPFVDPAFGTGVVKITPAHDPNDYQMALRHHLPMINIMTPDGRVNENGGAFAGQLMEEARASVAAKLKELGHLEKVLPHTNRVGVSYRSKAVIEPYLSKQWFVRMEPFKHKLRDAVASAKVDLIPESWKSTYFHWIDNLRDWCISRQLWWGHRIPIWYSVADPNTMICHAGSGLPPEVQKEPAAWRQDEDVLDTWFSSGLWPFSTLGWPEKTADLAKFYPTSVLVTGHDILFFWVARMIAMGEYALGTFPFRHVFLHGLIYGKSYWMIGEGGGISYITGKKRDDYDLGEPLPPAVHSKWEKMSKSKGNIIDPLEIIDTYGADAMRMALCASATHAPQIDLDRRKFEEFKHFANKVWNGARFVFMNIESLTAESFARGIDRKLLALEDKWILSVLSRRVQEVNEHLERYAFDKAASSAYDFFWKEFCAYYVEIAKPVLFGKSGTAEEKENKQRLLLIILCQSIRLLHPMAPFITEELFSLLKERFASSAKGGDPYTHETLQALASPACMMAPYPSVVSPADIDDEIEASFAFIEKLVYAIREIRGEMQIPPGSPSDLIVVAPAASTERKSAEKHQKMIGALVRIQTISFEEKEPALPMSASAVVSSLKLIIPLPEELKEKEKVRLAKEKERLIQEQNRLATQLGNDAFIEKAPPQLVEKLRKQLVETEESLATLSKKLS